jgi:filamentous hemagglutinin
MEDYLATTDATPEEKKTYMELGASAIGGIVGGARGAAAALDGDRYNRQLHPDETAWIKQHATDFARQECNGCDPSQEQIEAATARLGQQASKDVDFIWKSVLGSGDDAAAQAFLASTDATFTNDLGKQQAMFTVERGQFFAPVQNAPDADLDFVEKYVRLGASRDMDDGLAEESSKYASALGGAIKNDPLGVGKNVVVGLAEAIGDAVSHPVNTFHDFKDGFVSGAQNIGEGAAVSLDQSLQDRMQLLYGQDVSGAIKTVTALQVTAALGNAIGAGKVVSAGAKAAVEKTGVLVEKAIAKEAFNVGYAEVWNLAPTVRGQTIEKVLAGTEYSGAAGWYQVGAEKNGFFPLVDFQKGNNLVSLKTVDTNGGSWLSDMKSHITDLSSSGATVNDKSANMILDLRVQPGGAAAAQQLIEYGQEHGVTVIVKEFK